jgi:glycosyltransferase involved in cell wall biosynthesis
MNIDVINLPFNLGYGSALQTGYKYAVKKGYQYVISYDADYQHRANDLSIVYSILVNNKSDIVIGSRFLKRQVQATFLKTLPFYCLEL